MVNCIQLQRELSQELPVVIGNKDYTIFRSILERMEEMINLGQLDHVACDYLVRIEEEKRRRSAEKKGNILQGLVRRRSRRSTGSANRHSAVPLYEL